MLNILVCTFTLGMAGCPDPGTRPTKTSQAYQCDSETQSVERFEVSQFEEAQLTLENFSKNIEGGRDEDYHPTSVLKLIHPWFGKNLCAYEREGQKIFTLSPIADSVIQDLQLAQKNKSALGVLNARFWQKVQRLQEKGLKPSFLEFEPSFEVAGYYDSHTKIVGLDIFANPGTPDHEYRHHLQKLELPHPQEPEYLSRPCTQMVARFLGELDATTIQISHWVGAFDEIGAKENELKTRRYPQASFLGVNLNYPALAATWVKPGECPRELDQAIRKIVNRTEKAELAISPLAPRLVNFAYSLARLLKEHEKVCAQDLSLCELSAQRIEKNRNQIWQLKSNLNAALQNESVERPAYIREILAELPTWIKLDLSNSSGAFRLIMREAKEGLWD